MSKRALDIVSMKKKLGVYLKKIRQLVRDEKIGGGVRLALCKIGFEMSGQVGGMMEGGQLAGWLT